MNPLAKLLAIALAWPFPSPPSGYEREAEPEYKERVATIVSAITTTTSDADEAAALLVLSRDESTFDRWIHAGLKHPDPRKHQDHGRARCVLQIHKSRLVPEWEELAGTDLSSTVKCMRAGLRLLRGAAGFCKASLHTRAGLERALSLYATGKSCKPIALAKERAARWAQVRDAMRTRPAKARPASAAAPMGASLTAPLAPRVAAVSPRGHLRLASPALAARPHSCAPLPSRSPLVPSSPPVARLDAFRARRLRAVAPARAAPLPVAA